MAIGIPTLTLSPEGMPVAIYGDGDVIPLQQTPLGGFNASDTTQGRYGAGVGPDQGGAILPGGASLQGGSGAALGDGSPLLTSGGLNRPGDRPAGPPSPGYGDYAAPVPPPSDFVDIPGTGGGPGLFGLGSPGPGDGSGRSLTAMGNSLPSHDGGSGAGPSQPSGGGRLPNAADRINAARGRFRAAFGSDHYHDYSSAKYDYGSSSAADVEKPKPIPTHYGKMDEAQAAGLTSRPSALIPLVFKGLTPDNPVYGRLKEIPAGEMGLIMGRGTPRSLVNKTGDIYHDVGMFGDIPTTDKLLSRLTRGRGVKDMFQGVKTRQGDTESYSAPGYVYGQEPMGMGTATQRFASLLDAALYGSPVAEKYGSEGWGGYLMDKWAARALKRPAGKGKPIYRYVGRHLFD
jgi:hypothetical protein